MEISHDYFIKDIQICANKIIGKGSYAVVCVATYHGTKVAAKQLHSIFFEGVDPKEYKGILQSWLNEFKLMHSLRHPNIVQFYGVFNSDNPSSVLINGNSYIITELLEKSLQARNLEKPRLTIRHIIDIVMGIAAGLCYLHNRQDPIMHRDLASKNILLSISGQAKIADLGVAKFAKQMQQSHTRHPGTDYYMPLETVIASDDYDHSIDVYALGVIILEIAIGKNPTATQSLKRVGETYEVVPETERRRNDFNELQKGPNATLQKLIMLCVCEKEKRISATEVTRHLDELANSAIYQSCEVTSVFEVSKKILDDQLKLKETQQENNNLKQKIEDMKKENDALLDNQVKLKEAQQENNCLKQKIEDMKKEIDALKTNESAYQKKMEQDLQNTLKQQEFKNNMKSTSTNTKSEMQKVVASVPQQPPQKMSNSRMVMATHQSISHPLNNFAHNSSLDKPHIQSKNYRSPRSLSFDQSPVPLQSFRQPPKSIPVFDQPFRSFHYQRSESWCSDTPETPDFHDNPVYRDYLPLPGRNSQLDNNFTSLPPRLSDDPAIQRASEYLNYQISCMERVKTQLMSITSNTSENLVTSYVETLKEQIYKTTDYVIKLPNHIRTDQYLQAPLLSVYQALSNANFSKISDKYTKPLNAAITHFQGVLNNYVRLP